MSMFLTKSAVNWNHFGNHSSTTSMTDEAVELLFSQNASTTEIKNNSISKIQVCAFAANDPIEDRYSVLSGSERRDHFFGVYDGHGGTAAAEFAKEQLINYVQYNLHLKLQAQEAMLAANEGLANILENIHDANDWDTFEMDEKNAFFKNVAQQSSTGSISSPIIGHKNNATAIRDAFDVTRCIPDALKKAFQQADQAFLLSGVLDKANKLQDVFSGSCLLMTYMVDNWLFVANAGDCKAVLGKKFTNENGETSWIAMPLSTIHTAKSEQAIIMKEHPNEPDAVYQGRVKGFLEPSRGLGDALFKDKYFNRCLIPEAQIPEPFSPPYTTATPDIEIFRVNPNEDKDCFLILASDGLWDMISDQVAIDTVVESIKTGDNAATALTKRAMLASNFDGSTLTEKINNSLKLSSKIRRHFYDDTTSIVLFFTPNPNLNNVNHHPKIPRQSEAPPESYTQITEQLQDYLPPTNSAPS